MSDYPKVLGSGQPKGQGQKGSLANATSVTKPISAKSPNIVQKCHVKGTAVTSQAPARQRTPSAVTSQTRGRQKNASDVLPLGKGQLIPSMDAFPIVRQSDGTLAPKGYTMRPVVAAENYDVVSMAKAMNDDFAPRVKKLFDPETKAALQAQTTGVYIGWRLPGQKFDCQRINDASKCFCGHLLGEHNHYTGQSIRVPCRQGCSCKAFQWIPSRPEDVGEFWYQRRRNFEPETWRAKCRCKHTHEDHDCNSRKCKVRGCSCPVFDSNFLCAACDKHWEQHETFFETEATRMQLGLPVGEQYLPFAEMPNLRNAVLTGDENDNSVFLALTQGRGAIPITERPHGNDAVFKPQPSSGFKPVYD